MDYVLNRNFVLVTLTGRSIDFRKGKPTHVPPDCIKSAIAVGALPADGSDPSEQFDEPSLAKAPTDPLVRQEKILEVVRNLVARNDREDFTAAGLPSPKVVSKILGWSANLREITGVYRMYAEEKATQEEQAKLDKVE